MIVNDKKAINSIDLEKSILSLVKTYQNKYRGAKKAGEANKGFYYYFLKARHNFGYSLGAGTFSDNFDSIFTNNKRFTKLIKAWSAKFSRYIKGSETVISELEKNGQYIIEIPTLANQLNLSDFYILTQGISDRELLEIFRGRDYITNMKKEAAIEHELSKKLYENL